MDTSAKSDWPSSAPVIIWPTSSQMWQQSGAAWEEGSSAGQGHQGSMKVWLVSVGRVRPPAAATVSSLTHTNSTDPRWGQRHLGCAAWGHVSDVHIGSMLPSSHNIRLEYAQDQSSILVPDNSCAATTMPDLPDTKAIPQQSSPGNHTRQGQSKRHSRQAHLPGAALLSLSASAFLSTAA